MSMRRICTLASLAILVVASSGCNQEELEQLKSQAGEAKETLVALETKLVEKEKEWSAQLATAKQSAEESLAKAKANTEAAIADLKKASSDKLAQAQLTVEETKKNLEGTTEKLTKLQAELEKSVSDSAALKTLVAEKDKMLNEAQQKIQSLEQALEQAKKDAQDEAAPTSGEGESE